jgi:signal transduction histidine kinase
VVAVSAGARLSPEVSAAIVAETVAAFLIAGIVSGAAPSAIIGWTAGFIGLWAFGLTRRAYLLRAIDAEQALEQARRAHAAETQAAALAERARIAREIHDVLAHSLGALGIQIQTARAVLTDQRDVDRAIDVLLTAQRMAAEGLTETRRAVHALRTDHRPLNTELGQVAADHGERYHVGVSFAVDGVPRPLPPDATVALLRTAQEALVNAAKHAPGQDVAVQLDYDDRDVRLRVANQVDQARSVAVMTATTNGGYGLTGMRERLRLLDGTLVAGPRDGQWVVAAAVTS